MLVQNLLLIGAGIAIPITCILMAGGEKVVAICGVIIIVGLILLGWR